MNFPFWCGFQAVQSWISKRAMKRKKICQKWKSTSFCWSQRLCFENRKVTSSKSMLRVRHERFGQRYLENLQKHFLSEVLWLENMSQSISLGDKIWSVIIGLPKLGNKDANFCYLLIIMLISKLTEIWNIWIYLLFIFRMPIDEHCNGHIVKKGPHSETLIYFAKDVPL